MDEKRDSFLSAMKSVPHPLWAVVIFFLSLGCIYDFRLDVGGRMLDIPLILLVLSAFWGFSTTEGRLSTGEYLRRDWHVILFFLVTVVVTWYSTNRAQSLAVQPQLLPSLLLFAMVGRFVETRRQLVFLLTGLVLTGLLICCHLVYMLYTVEGEHPLFQINRLRWPLFVAPNDVLILSVFAPLALGLCFIQKTLLPRLLLLVYLIFSLVVIVLLESRQALAVYVVSLGFFCLLIRPMLGLLVALVMVVVAIVVDQLLGGVLVRKLFLFPRIYLWHTAWEMFLDRPLLGQGPGMFKVLYPEFLPRAGYVFEELSDRRPMNWAHSLYIEQLAERGVAGFVALLLLLAKPVFSLFSVYRRSLVVRRDELAMAVLSAFLAFLLAGIAEASLVRLWVVPVMFVLLAMASVLPAISRDV